MVCVLFSTVTWANSELDYGPIFEAKTVHIVTPKPCTLKAETAFVLNTDEVIKAYCGKDELSITGIDKRHKNSDEKTTSHIRIELSRAQQKPLLATIRASEFPADFVDSVSMLDLNGDDKMDYIIDLSSHGNGLAASIGGVLLLLSRNEGYQYVSMEHIVNTPNRFLRFDKTHAVVMMVERLQQYRSHDYFLFDLIGFLPDAPHGVRSENNLDDRFPFWTLYTDKPTHTQTDRISSATKRALWLSPLSQMHFGSFRVK